MQKCIIRYFIFLKLFIHNDILIFLGAQYTWGSLIIPYIYIFIYDTMEKAALDIDMILILISAMIECGLAESGNITRIYHRNAGYKAFVPWVSLFIKRHRPCQVKKQWTH